VMRTSYAANIGTGSSSGAITVNWARQ
jgi:hypothetical protein